MTNKVERAAGLWPGNLLRDWQVSEPQVEAGVAGELATQLALPATVAEHLVAVYAPLAERLAQRLPGMDEPPVLGINGAQGTGKSTAADVLAKLLERRGFQVCCLSIDDLYLTRAERQRLAEAVHPLLQTRGVPGTHDLALGRELLAALKSAGPSARTAIPRFDKARDDRKPPQEWDVWPGRPDLIVFEGWCVGARPDSEASLSEPVNELESREDPDGRWRRYAHTQLGDYQALFEMLDYLVMLKAPSFDQVYQWRSEQEAALAAHLAAQGVDAPNLMSTSDLKRFIQHYERMTRWILQEMPERADLLLELNAAHRVHRISAPEGERL